MVDAADYINFPPFSANNHPAWVARLLYNKQAEARRIWVYFSKDKKQAMAWSSGAGISDPDKAARNSRP